MNDEQAIRDLQQTWQEATVAGDVDRVSALMTEDVVFLVPGQPPMAGRAAFLDAARAGKSRYSLSYTFRLDEISISGDVAYSRTYLSLTMTPTDGSPAVKRSGFTLSIYRKEGGRWLLARDANLLAVDNPPAKR